MSCFSKNRWELGLHTSGTSSTFEGVGSPGKSSKEEKSATDSSPNPMSTASVDLAMIIKYTKLFIDNNFVDSAATRHGLLEVKNPFNGSVLALVTSADAVDVDHAVLAASRAFKGVWSKFTAIERRDLLERLAHLMEKNKRELAIIETLETGKLFRSSYYENIPETIEMLRYYAGLCDKIDGRLVNSNQCHLSYVLKEPIGVCALITPWNSSLRNVISKLAPALAMGNTCVAKVSELTPLSALRLAALVKEAGFPPGVVNIIAGIGDKAGEHLVTHPLVNKIAFGGCTATGKRILSLAAGTVKRVTASLGGKSASVICSDADLQYAAETTCEGMFRNSGESCTSLCRVYVHETLYGAFIAQAIQYCKIQKLGDPFDEASTMGPIATDSQFLRTIGYIDRAKEDGAKLLIGGNTKEKFVEPTIFANVSDEMEISRNEIFGPVMCVFSFKNDEEAINRVNSSQYGLWAAVFTKSMVKSSKYSKELKVGTVAINCNSTSASLPFGGFRESGFGREGGLEGLSSYTEVKVVSMCTGI